MGGESERTDELDSLVAQEDGVVGLRVRQRETTLAELQRWRGGPTGIVRGVMPIQHKRYCSQIIHLYYLAISLCVASPRKVSRNIPFLAICGSEI